MTTENLDTANNVDTEGAIEAAIAPKAGSLLEKYMQKDALAEFGLDDLPTGGGINRIYISHKATETRPANQFGSRMIDGIFHEDFKAVILGRIAGRSMWADRNEGDDAQSPLCQSHDAKTGYGTNRLNFASTKLAADVDGVAVAITRKGLVDIDDDERVQLDCSTCELSNDGRRDGGTVWSKPECSDLTSLAILVDFFQKGTLEPAVITFKSSALKPVHGYLGQITQLGEVPLMYYTHFSLTQNQIDDDTIWSVPVLTRGEKTHPGPEGATWEGYLEQWESLKITLTTPYIPSERNEAFGDPAEGANSRDANQIDGTDEDF